MADAAGAAAASVGGDTVESLLGGATHIGANFGVSVDIGGGSVAGIAAGGGAKVAADGMLGIVADGTDAAFTLMRRIGRPVGKALGIAPAGVAAVGNIGAAAGASGWISAGAASAGWVVSIGSVGEGSLVASRSGVSTSGRELPGAALLGGVSSSVRGAGIGFRPAGDSSLGVEWPSNIGLRGSGVTRASPKGCEWPSCEEVKFGVKDFGIASAADLRACSGATTGATSRVSLFVCGQIVGNFGIRGSAKGQFLTAGAAFGGSVERSAGAAGCGPQSCEITGIRDAVLLPSVAS